MNAPSIQIINEDRKDEWNAFVQSFPGASFFQRWEWGEIIKNVYGYDSVRFAAIDNDKIIGVAPLVDVKSRLFGRSLISTAFTIGGGVAAQDSAITPMAKAIVEEGRGRSVQYVEMRHEKAVFDGWATKNTTYANFSKTMPQTTDERLSAIPRKRRAEIRKSLKLRDEGRLSIRFDGDVDTFHQIYARSVRDLGTPVFPKRFAHQIVEKFGDAVEITIVEAGGMPVAALLSYYFRDRVMPYYVGSLPEAKPLRAYDFLYWSLMERAAERSAFVFDFGRSKFDTPHFAYKKLWGFEPEPLAYQYALVKAKQIPDVNPNNPKFKAISSAWKHLPIPVANFAGALLASNLA